MLISNDFNKFVIFKSLGVPLRVITAEKYLADSYPTSVLDIKLILLLEIYASFFLKNLS